MGQQSTKAISDIQRNNMRSFERLKWRNSTLFRQFYAFLTDRSLSFTVAALSIYGIIAKLSMTEMLFMVGSNPFITVMVAALPLFMVWNQYVTYRKQKRFEEKCAEIEAEIRENIETAFRIQHNLVNKALTIEQARALDVEVALVLQENKVHHLQTEAVFLKKDLEHNVKTWKRTISPAARSTWVALLVMSFVAVPSVSTGLLGAGVAVGMIIAMLFLTKHLYAQKQHNQQKLDKLHSIRAASVDKLKTAQQHYFAVIQDAKASKVSLDKQIDDLEVQLQSPELNSTQREKLTKYRSCLMQKRAVLMHKINDAKALEQTRDYDAERDVQAWHKVHKLLSVYTILPSMGIGSSIVSAITKMGATEWAHATGYVPFFAVLATVVFVGAFIELAASFLYINRSLKASVKSQENIRSLQRQHKQLTQSMSPEQYERYVYWYQQSPSMKLFAQNDHEMSDTFMQRRSPDYVGMKFFKKLYKATKALSFVLIMQAFHIIPAGLLAPLIVLGVMAVISVSEYAVKTKNAFHLKRLKHEETYLREDLALKQQAFDYLPSPNPQHEPLSQGQLIERKLEAPAFIHANEYSPAGLKPKPAFTLSLTPITAR